MSEKVTDSLPNCERCGQQHEHEGEEYQCSVCGRRLCFAQVAYLQMDKMDPKSVGFYHEVFVKRDKGYLSTKGEQVTMEGSWCGLCERIESGGSEVEAALDKIDPPSDTDRSET